MTDAAVWDRVQSLFHQALALPLGDRRSWVETECAGEPTVATQVFQMLAADGVELRPLPDFVQHLLLTPQIPLEFDSYTLLEPLGEGGMGVVWLAESKDAHKRVAVKLLLNAGLSPARRERFALEVQTLAQLNHPHIACLYNAGTLANGTPWFAMEFVKGVSLDSACRNIADVQEFIRLFRKVCQAVRYAHSQGVIHRDLKPTNILVTDDQTPKLLDFGIARQIDPAHDPKLSSVGPRFLSLDYAAPEWIFSGDASTYTDIYSLGVLFYLALAGELPFPPGERKPNSNPAKPSTLGKNRFPLSRVQWNELDGVCLKAMECSVSERYQTVDSLIRDLDHFLNGEPVEAHPQSVLYRTRKFVSRHRLSVFATSVALLLIVSITAAFTIRLAEARNAAIKQASRKDHLQQFTVGMFEGFDKEAGAADNLRVEDLLDLGARQGPSLINEPAIQADLRQTLGVLYQKIGKFNKADQQLRMALETRRSTRPADNSALTQTLTALALLRSDQGRNAEAENLVQEAISIVESDKLGQPLANSTHAAFARILIESGRTDQAIQVLNQIAASQSTQNASFPERSKTLITLAEAHLMRGHSKDCETYARQALAMDRHLFSSSHPRVAEDLHYLSEAEEQLGRYPEAEDQERQALAIVQNWYGDQSPNTARMMSTLSQTLTMEQRYDAAEALLVRALAIQTKAYGPTHPTIAYTLNSLATVAMMRKDFKHAEEYGLRVFQIYRANFPETDRRAIVGLGNLATMYLKMGRLPQAEAMFRDFVAKLTQAMGTDAIDTATGHIKLGRTLLHEKKFAEAKSQTKLGYDVLFKQSPKSIFLSPARADLAAEESALRSRK